MEFLASRLLSGATRWMLMDWHPMSQASLSASFVRVADATQNWQARFAIHQSPSPVLWCLPDGDDRRWQRGASALMIPFAGVLRRRGMK